MYYLLGYRLLGSDNDSIYSNQSDVGKSQREQVPINTTQMTHRSKIFRSMNHFQRAQVFNFYDSNYDDLSHIARK